jgi:RNA polymerase sigma-70 factor (ECF subfamily)
MEGTRVLNLVPPEGDGRPLSQCSDDELMQLTAAGKATAFACLVRRHQASVRAYCTRVCGPSGDDVAQEVFVAVHRARESYLPEGRFRSFLFTIASRRCKNALRHVRARREDLLEVAREEAGAATSLDVILKEERQRRLHALVKSLPEAQRTAIQLRFSAGLDYAELGEAVGCPEPTARTRVHLGLAKLRTLLGKRGGL